MSVTSGNGKLPAPFRKRGGLPWAWCLSSRNSFWGLGEWRYKSLPKISVVIPSFNQGRFLEASIRSVLLQDYPTDRIECIVIDGGSTDESKEILEYYAPWLTYWVSESDRGQSHAINKGLARASGDLLAYLNSDDLYAPGCFRTVGRAADLNPEVGLFHGDRILLSAEDQILGWSCLEPFHPAAGFTVASETAFWRRNLNPGEFDESLQFAMDLDYFGRLYGRVPFRKLDRFLGYFRCHPAAKSATMQDVCDKESSRLWRRHFGTRVPPVCRHQKPGKMRLVLAAVRAPLLVLLPYLASRASLGKTAEN